MQSFNKYIKTLLKYNMKRNLTSKPILAMDYNLKPIHDQDHLKTIKEEFRGYDTDKPTSIDLTLDKHIAVITLNNPNRLNSLTGKMMVDFSEAIDKIEEDIKNEESILVGIIIEGKGKNLCAGFDLDLAQEKFQSSESGGKLCSLMQDNFERVKRLPLISVCAIEGYALGGGAELSTSTDFRIAASTSIVRFVHCNIGIVPGWGGATRLTEILGYKDTIFYLATTNPIPVPEIGNKSDFFDIVCETGNATHTAHHFLTKFINDSVQAQSIRNIKSLMVAQRLTTDTTQKLKLEKQAFTQLWGSPHNLKAISIAKSKKGKKV